MKLTKRMLRARETLVRMKLAQRQDEKFCDLLRHAVNDEVTEEEIQHVHDVTDDAVELYKIDGAGLFAALSGRTHWQIRYKTVAICVRLIKTFMENTPNTRGMKPSKRHSSSSYGFKHRCEDWLKLLHPTENYVSNGEGILIALVLKHDCPYNVQLSKIPARPRHYSRNEDGTLYPWDPNIDDICFGRWYDSFRKTTIDSYDYRKIPKIYSLIYNEKFWFNNMPEFMYEDFMDVCANYTLNPIEILMSFFTPNGAVFTFRTKELNEEYNRLLLDMEHPDPYEAFNQLVQNKYKDKLESIKRDKTEEDQEFNPSTGNWEYDKSVSRLNSEIRSCSKYAGSFLHALKED